MKTCLGIELGSTRIKAVTIDEAFQPVSSGDYTWASAYENGIWTYSLEEVWTGLKSAIAKVENREKIAAAGVSAMMHGYLAFDKDWKLLVPFRTWQNTITGPAAAELTGLFGFNIPQRWSIAHLYQAVLNGEEHISRIAHITTLAGYIHYMLTGVNAVGVGEASGMFPIDSAALDYDAGMMAKFNALPKVAALPWKLEDLLPQVLAAGQEAGSLTEGGAALLEGLLPAGIPFAPAEGDAGTGMTATNAVAPRTGNVSAGTSIFSMVVLEKPLAKVYEEIDLVTTPAGAPVAMVHCNNCTNDTNAWVNVLGETARLFGADPDSGALYTKLYEKSLEGDPDCGGVLVCNYLAGEGVTHMDAGRPLVVRTPETKFTLANFFRAQLYATMSTLKLGMDILAQEGVAIDSLTGHGGLFKTPVVGQSYMAAACNAPVTCMETAGEGGPYGMALLASFLLNRGQEERLEDFLSSRVFAGTTGSTIQPDPAAVEGFNAYIQRYKALLEVEQTAVRVL
ncbi:ATPase [Pseudoflavonifractor sp. 60]|uniref:xylulokinase n=1 Tax=Pseudoflavonifractor sp. 60 TaxID=2304576 RepID=UPI00136888A4|nr:FGGY-family carbohydrate kinase [Pseudoflavonifractor sp. 60]NBI68288.1 ATPase [Pseudoflavonifractor sp. 60]